MSETVKVQLPHNYGSLGDCQAAFSAVPENDKLCNAIMALDDKVDTLWGDLYSATRTLQQQVIAKQNEIITRERASGNEAQLKQLEGDVEVLLQAVRVTTDTMAKNTAGLKRQRTPRSVHTQHDQQVALDAIQKASDYLRQRNSELKKRRK
jgi:hypothetical protein